MRVIVSSLFNIPVPCTWHWLLHAKVIAKILFPSVLIICGGSALNSIHGDRNTFLVQESACTNNPYLYTRPCDTQSKILFHFCPGKGCLAVEGKNSHLFTNLRTPSQHPSCQHSAPRRRLRPMIQGQYLLLQLLLLQQDSNQLDNHKNMIKVYSLPHPFEVNSNVPLSRTLPSERQSPLTTTLLWLVVPVLPVNNSSSSGSPRRQPETSPFAIFGADSIPSTSQPFVTDKY